MLNNYEAVVAETDYRREQISKLSSKAENGRGRRARTFSFKWRPVLSFCSLKSLDS